MAFHHIAVAARNMLQIDAFYTGATGFELVKVEVAPTPQGGTGKHFFYDTGNGEMMAFWELHGEAFGDDYKTALSTDMGLPEWVNHISFHSGDRADLDARRERWVGAGYDVLEIDHDWCISIYTLDPNGTLVEFCWTTREFSDDDRAHAKKALHTDDLEHAAPPKFLQFKGDGTPLHLRADVSEG